MGGNDDWKYLFTDELWFQNDSFSQARFGGGCLSRRFDRSPFSQKHQLRRVACFLRWLIKPIRQWTAMTLAVWADIVTVWQWLVFCSMSGNAGFLKQLDATTFKTLYTNTAGNVPLWTAKNLSLPGFSGYVTCFQVVFQDILVPLVLTSSWTLTTDQLPVEKCLWYSVFLHANKMSSRSELALDE